MAYGNGLVSVWDTFPKATHGSIAFPIESSSIEGGLRDHVHEYPHSPGGAPEKLGRKLYTFKVTANFDTNFDNYAGLYPQDLDTILGNWEQGTTQDLRLPQMAAAVPAYAFQWTREQTSKVRSGEKVSVMFREDQSSVFLFADIANVGTGQIELAASTVAGNLAALSASLQPTPATLGLLDALQQAAGFVQSFKDQAILYDSRFQAAVAQVQNICGQLDSAVDLQTIAAYPVIEAIHSMWDSAQKLGQDLQSTGAQLQTWINPTTQGVVAIAQSLYGDTSRASDLLSLNPFPDSLRVKAGTPVRYYPA